MSYDVLIIGSGPGGYVAAIRAAQYGLKVGVVEKNAKLGGTCLHVGCVPTKALLHFAEVYEQTLHAGQIGIKTSGVELDFGRMQQRKREIVAGHAKGIEFLFKRNKIDRIAGFGKLLGRGRAGVANAGGQTEISARHIVLATGSEARTLPGLSVAPDKLLTNVEILELSEVPRSLAIIGAGAVGVEFASIYGSFGSEVTIIEALPRMVPLEDEEISTELARAFRRRRIRAQTGAQVEKAEDDGDLVRIEFSDSEGKQQQLSAEKLLVAVGRSPNTEKIGLENTAVQTKGGFIQVNEWMETAEPGVRAIGDIVAGSPQLAHVASMEGLVAAGHIAGKDVDPINYSQSPSAVYCEPQIGSVGLTEAQAREQGRTVKIGKFNFRANSKASILGRHGGFVKVVAGESSGEILGVHIIGPSATELISEAVVAMASEATVESITSTIHAHPTLSEAVQEAFNSVYGMAINA